MHVSKAFPDFEVCISFEVFGRDMVKLANFWHSGGPAQWQSEGIEEVRNILQHVGGRRLAEPVFSLTTMCHSQRQGMLDPCWRNGWHYVGQILLYTASRAWVEQGSALRHRMSNDKESRAAKLTEEHQAQRILDVLHFPGYNKGVFKPANNSLVQKTRGPGEISGGSNFSIQHWQQQQCAGSSIPTWISWQRWNIICELVRVTCGHRFNADTRVINAVGTSTHSRMQHFLGRIPPITFAELLYNMLVLWWMIGLRSPGMTLRQHFASSNHYMTRGRSLHWSQQPTSWVVVWNAPLRHLFQAYQIVQDEMPALCMMRLFHR